MVLLLPMRAPTAKLSSAVNRGWLGNALPVLRQYPLRLHASFFALFCQFRIEFSNSDIDSAFASLAQTQVAAVLITPGPLFDNRRVQLVALAAHYRLPAIYPFRENVEIGGLMSYGSSAADRDRQVGIYTGRILKGEKPADLPIMRASKFELILNLQTAKTLGIEVPPGLLARADEVIE